MIKMNFNKNNFDNDIEDEKEDDKEKDDEDEDENEGLFILGVIERAAKERKRTKSVAFKWRIYFVFVLIQKWLIFKF